MAVKVDEDELIEHWTLDGDELGQVAGKRGATRLGFALLLKFFSRMGRFPRGRGELPDEAVAYVARQVGVPASDLGFYEWDGRTVEYHRAQVRKFLGFRECTVADAAKLAAWLAGEVCQSERLPTAVLRGTLAGAARAIISWLIEQHTHAPSTVPAAVMPAGTAVIIAASIVQVPSFPDRARTRASSGSGPKARSSGGSAAEKFGVGTSASSIG